MTDVGRKALLAGRHMATDWSPMRERRVRVALDHALVRRRRVTRVGASLLTLAAVVLGLVSFRLVGNQVSGVWRGTEPRTLLTLDDGSAVTPLNKDARVTAVAVGTAGTTLRLDAGSARFQVTHNPNRRFRVVADDTIVTVLGTTFRVELVAAGVEVGVEQGRVEVNCRSQPRVLIAGERLVCQKASSTDAKLALVPEPAPAAPVPSAAAPALASRVPQRTSTWRALAQDGDYHGAFSRLTSEGAAAVRDEPADLLFAADVARLSGHASAAVARLERVVRAHPSDSRAPLAAFTLGRILLDELGRPREAAEAFATAQRLSPGGALTQDALAREVESWSRAGELGAARQRAEQYLTAYPNGRRGKAVRHHAGLER